MSIVLYRVDERLIHGQVVVGWAELHATRIIVVDDALAESDWEQELYTLGLPDTLTCAFHSVQSARGLLAEWRRDATRTILLTRDVSTMYRLAGNGLMKGEDVNIGGIHHAPGRRAILAYVYLNDAELDALRSLVADGVHVFARDVPAGRRVEAAELLPAERRA